MMGNTVFDYEGPEAFSYLNPTKDPEQMPSMYYDEEKGVYVLTRDPETGEEIPEEEHTKPLADEDTRKRVKGRLMLGLLAVGGLFLATR